MDEINDNLLTEFEIIALSKIEMLYYFFFWCVLYHPCTAMAGYYSQSMQSFPNVK